MPAISSTVFKVDALRATGTLNPRPEGVIDPLFQEWNFFDARDMVHVKYEMLRKVAREHAPVQAAASCFGFSRVAWYQINARYGQWGLAGLLPQRRGPRPRPQKQPSRPFSGSVQQTGSSSMNVYERGP